MWLEDDDMKCWILNVEQDSEYWHQIRQRKITASNFSKYIQGHNPFSKSENTISDEENIQRGKDLEPFIRNWYNDNIAKVKEIGLAVPYFDPNISCSPDGILDLDQNGLIEIKCPNVVYPSLINKHFANIQDMNNQDAPNKYSHIYPSHFDQMQGNMAILRKDFCDYLVYGPKYLNSNNKILYQERIYFCPNYWEEIIYQNIQKFTVKNE